MSVTAFPSALQMPLPSPALKKHTFSVRIAHKFDPADKTKAQYYTIVANGEAADKAYSL
jgi:hypothetical protein